MTNLEFNILHDQTEELLNQIYNHKETCELLIHQGTEYAVKHFYKQSKVLSRLAPDHIEELRCIFLNSLNRCLYNYILFRWDISLSECCFRNKELTHAWKNEKVFLEAGQEIISAYGKLLTSHSSEAIHVRRAVQYIDEHLSEDLSLTSVAEYIYISKCYLCKIFKSFTGYSFVQYVNYKRLLQAEKMLLSTNHRVDLIALECGFHTASYFSTLFRKEYGCSPNEYRNTASIAVV